MTTTTTIRVDTVHESLRKYNASIVAYDTVLERRIRYRRNETGNSRDAGGTDNAEFNNWYENNIRPHDSVENARRRIYVKVFDRVVNGVRSRLQEEFAVLKFTTQQACHKLQHCVRGQYPS
jgi:hypothetical protein